VRPRATTSTDCESLPVAKHWNRHDSDERVAFAQLLRPLVIASRVKDFTAAEASVYMLTMEDVPREVVIDAVTRLLREGVTWMPKPGDLKHACCAVVDARRLSAARQAKALQEDCPDCRGSGWADAEGPNAVVRCNCIKRALELVAEAGEALARPALPPSSEEVV
jgi:hypothetical protein